jgi:hypothetical protein
LSAQFSAFLHAMTPVPQRRPSKYYLKESNFAANRIDCAVLSPIRQGFRGSVVEAVILQRHFIERRFSRSFGPLRSASCIAWLVPK